MTERKVGATGRYPNGKLCEYDEGELGMMIGNMDGKVVFEFGCPVRWFALPADMARVFADHIVARADLAEMEAAAAKEVEP